MPETDSAGAPATAHPVLLLPEGEGGGMRDKLLSLAILGASGSVLAGSALSSAPWMGRSLALMGSLLLATSLLLGAVLLLRSVRRGLARGTAATLIRQDPSDCCLADSDGRILARSPAPPRPAEAPATVAEALAPLLADAHGLLHRLQSEAIRAGRAEAEVATRWGPQRLTVQRIEADTFFWRGEALGDLPAAGQPDRARDWDSIEDLPLPLLRLAPCGIVLSANRHARALLPMEVGEGTRLSDLLEGLGRPLVE